MANYIYWAMQVPNPWTNWNAIAADCGKTPSIGTVTYTFGTAFSAHQADLDGFYGAGACPAIDWFTSLNGSNPPPPANLCNPAIIAGQQDVYINAFANAIKSWGKPLIIFFCSEPNGAWYSAFSDYCNGANGTYNAGNYAGSFVAMWNHVTGIFDSLGVPQVTWVLTLNNQGASGATAQSVQPYSQFFSTTRKPGLMGIDAFNPGSDPTSLAPWFTFDQIMDSGGGSYLGTSWDNLIALDPNIPCAVSSFGTTGIPDSTTNPNYATHVIVDGQRKGSWLTDALSTQMQGAKYSRLKLFRYYNTDGSGGAGPPYNSGNYAVGYSPSGGDNAIESPTLAAVPTVALGNGTTGTVTSATANTLTDSTLTAARALPNVANQYVRITSGTGSGQIIQIASNTTTTLTLASNWSTVPDTTSHYQIGLWFTPQNLGQQQTAWKNAIASPFYLPAGGFPLPAAGSGQQLAIPYVAAGGTGASDSLSNLQQSVRGLVAYHRLGDVKSAGGAASDFFGFAGGSYQGNPVDVASLIAGTQSHALSLDGATYVSVPDAAVLSPEAVLGMGSRGVWYQESAAPAATAAILCKGNNGAWEFVLQRTTTGFAVTYWQSDGSTHASLTYTVTPTLNAPHHLLVVYNLSGPVKLALYYDGQLAASSTAVNPGTSLAHGAAPLTVGRRGSGDQPLGTAANPARVQDVATRNVPLDAFEVLRLYNAGIHATPDRFLAEQAAVAGRVAHYRLGDASKAANAAAVDSVGGLNGTYQGSCADAAGLVQGTLDRALSLNGSSYVTVLDSDAFSPQVLPGHGTWEVWYQESAVPAGTQAIIAKGNAASGQSLSTVMAAPPATLQSLVNATASGGTLNVPPNVCYREAVTISNPITINLPSSTRVCGSDDWSVGGVSGCTWSGAGPYTSSLTVPSMNAGATADGNIGADWRMTEPCKVLLDGVLQVQLQSGTPAAGQWVFDASRHVLLGTSPSGHRVEVVTRQAVFTINASNVTIQSSTNGQYAQVEHCGSSYQRGAINLLNDGVNNLTLKGLRVAWAHAYAISIQGNNSGHLIDTCWTYETGQGPLNGGSSGPWGSQARSGSITVRSGLFERNNVNRGWTGGWDAGLKVVCRTGLLYEKNYFRDFNSVGVWCDNDSSGAASATIQDNYLENIAGAGIMYEIQGQGASQGYIRRNKLSKCGWGSGTVSGGWRFDAGILLSSSVYVDVADNVVAWSKYAYSFIWKNRSEVPTNSATHITAERNVALHQWGAQAFTVAATSDSAGMTEASTNNTTAGTPFIGWLDPDNGGSSALFSDASNTGSGWQVWASTDGATAVADASGNTRFAYNNVESNSAAAFSATRWGSSTSTFTTAQKTSTLDGSADPSGFTGQFLDGVAMPAAYASLGSWPSVAVAGGWEYAIQRTTAGFNPVFWDVGGGTVAAIPTGAFTPTPNVPHHLVLVFDNAATNKVSFYYDGALATYTTTLSSSLTNGTAPFTIGERGAGDQLAGSVANPVIIDEVVVRNVALSATDVLRLYNAGRGVLAQVAA